MRYYVNTPAQCALIGLSLDRLHSLRDAMGLPTPRPQMVHVPSRGLVLNQGQWPQCHDQPGKHWPVIEGDDGTAAIMLPVDEIATVNAVLGTTVSGVAIPRANQLIEEAALPARVKAELDRRRAAGEV